MTQPVQNTGSFSFPGQFPVTAPDLAVAGSPSNPSAGGIVDMSLLATETISELQNLQQDLTNRLIEMPGSNLDFGTPNTRGIGIMAYLSAASGVLVGLPRRIDHEFEQDPRVISSLTTLVTQPDGSKLVSTQITAVSGVFGLAWGWSQAGVVPL